MLINNSSFEYILIKGSRKNASRVEELCTNNAKQFVKIYYLLFSSRSCKTSLLFESDAEWPRTENVLAFLELF